MVAVVVVVLLVVVCGDGGGGLRRWCGGGGGGVVSFVGGVDHCVVGVGGCCGVGGSGAPTCLRLQDVLRARHISTVHRSNLSLGTFEGTRYPSPDAHIASAQQVRVGIAGLGGSSSNTYDPSPPRTPGNVPSMSPAGHRLPL